MDCEEMDDRSQGQTLHGCTLVSISIYDLVGLHKYTVSAENGKVEACLGHGYIL